LVNGRFGDPALYVETLFEQRAVLFDLGDISALAPRKIARLEHIFVSHAHIDHFVGFDRLLRTLVGREKTINLYGPEGFAERVKHKLHAYHWNLVDRYLADLIFVVSEITASPGSVSGAGLATRTTRFRLKGAFAEEPVGRGSAPDGVLLRAPEFQVAAAVLEHRTPCLGYALEESAHVNVWKSRLAKMGLPVGPWLRELKRAVIAGEPDDHPIRIQSRFSQGTPRKMQLGALRQVLTITAGQKIAYVTDVANTPANRDAIVRLAKGADLLFIEAAFAACDAALAKERSHLTTTAAGQLARAAKVRRVEAFHFSPRYEGEEARLLDEVARAFAGETIMGDTAANM